MRVPRNDPTNYSYDDLSELRSNFEDAVNAATDTSNQVEATYYMEEEDAEVSLSLGTLLPTTIGSKNRLSWLDAVDEILADINSIDEEYPSFVSFDVAVENEDGKTTNIAVIEFEYVSYAEAKHEQNSRTVRCGAMK